MYTPKKFLWTKTSADDRDKLSGGVWFDFFVAGRTGKLRTIVTATMSPSPCRENRTFGPGGTEPVTHGDTVIGPRSFTVHRNRTYRVPILWASRARTRGLVSSSVKRSPSARTGLRRNRPETLLLDRGHAHVLDFTCVNVCNRVESARTFARRAFVVPSLHGGRNHEPVTVGIRDQTLGPRLCTETRAGKYTVESTYITVVRTAAPWAGASKSPVPRPQSIFSGSPEDFR